MTMMTDINKTMQNIVTWSWFHLANKIKMSIWGSYCHYG